MHEEVHAQVGSIFEFVDGQRVVVTRDIARERAAVFQAIASEREEVFRSLAGERAEVLRAIANERQATMRDIDSLTLAVLERVTQQSQSAVAVGVDRVYLRALELLAIPFLFIVISVIILMFWVRSTVNRVMNRAQ